ncbi:MAG: glycosyltransferase family 4 protein [Flavobacteriaceae bacterium]
MTTPNIWIISQFSGAPKIGGVQRHFLLAQHWQKKGYDPIVFADPKHHLILPNQRSYKQGLELIDGVKFYWIPSGKHPQTSILRFLPMFVFAFKLAWIRLSSQLPKPQLIILSTMSIFPMPTLFWLKWRFRVPKCVVEVRDLWPLTPILMHGISKWNPLILYMKFLERWGYRKADAIVSVLSKADAYINPISQNPDKFKYIPNGIPDALLDNNLQQKFPKKQTSRIKLTYAGALGIGNGMDTFMDFLSAQPEDISAQYEFEFIGSGYRKAAYEQALAKVSNVSFHPKITREELHKHLAQTDICFIAWRNLPLYRYGVAAQKYFDYMAAGKPILAAQVGIDDFVVQSQGGIVCENNTTGFLKGLRAFAELSPIERNQMGLRGQAYVDQFRYSKIADQYLAFLNS